MIFYKKATLLSFVLFLFLLISTSTSSASTFNAHYDRLDNGMEIVVIPNHRAPVVHHMVWYKVGAADEEWGKSGLAHLFEHLMFRGTETLADGEFSKTIAALGGRDNAFTTQDSTAYHQSISVEHLEKVMQMEADRMAHLNLTDDIIEKERNVVIEERKQRLENNPFGRFFERLNTLLYTNHPYSIPTIGWLHEIESYTKADVIDFYKKWYAPNNAILVVSGDVTLQHVKELAQSTYGTLPPRSFFKERKRPEIPENITPDFKSYLVYHDPQITQVYWQNYRLVPSHGMDLKTSIALDIIVELLDGSEAAPIYETLVKKEKKAISASLSYSGSKLDWGVLTYSGILKSENDISTFKDRFETILKDFYEHGLTEENVKNARRKTIDRLLYARDSLSDPAHIFGRALTTGITFEQVENWETHLKSVTLEEIKKVYNTYILNYAGPTPEIEAKLLPPKKSEQNKENDND